MYKCVSDEESDKEIEEKNNLWSNLLNILNCESIKLHDINFDLVFSGKKLNLSLPKLEYKTPNFDPVFALIDKRLNELVDIISQKEKLKEEVSKKISENVQKPVVIESKIDSSTNLSTKNDNSNLEIEPSKQSEPKSFDNFKADVVVQKEEKSNTKTLFSQREKSKSDDFSNIKVKQNEKLIQVEKIVLSDDDKKNLINLRLLIQLEQSDQYKFFVSDKKSPLILLIMTKIKPTVKKLSRTKESINSLIKSIDICLNQTKNINIESISIEVTQKSFLDASQEVAAYNQFVDIDNLYCFIIINELFNSAKESLNAISNDNGRLWSLAHFISSLLRYLKNPRYEYLLQLILAKSSLLVFGIWDSYNCDEIPLHYTIIRFMSCVFVASEKYTELWSFSTRILNESYNNLDPCISYHCIHGSIGLIIYWLKIKYPKATDKLISVIKNKILFELDKLDKIDELASIPRTRIMHTLDNQSKWDKIPTEYFLQDHEAKISTEAF